VQVILCNTVIFIFLKRISGSICFVSLPMHNISNFLQQNQFCVFNFNIIVNYITIYKQPMQRESLQKIVIDIANIILSNNLHNIFLTRASRSLKYIFLYLYKYRNNFGLVAPLFYYYVLLTIVP